MHFLRQSSMSWLYPGKLYESDNAAINSDLALQKEFDKVLVPPEKRAIKDSGWVRSLLFLVSIQENIL